MSKFDEIDLINHVLGIFEWRKRPPSLLTGQEVSCTEIEDLKLFANFSRYETTGDIWEKFFDIYCFFSAEAFCYYLPGIIRASLDDDEPNLIVISSIINELDRSSDQEAWDELFLDRWSLLTHPELCVVQDWVWWLSSKNNTSFSDDSLMRSIETLENLKTRNLD